MTFATHIFVLTFTVVYPVAGYISYQKLLEKTAAGEAIDRVRLYRGTTINQWLLFAAGAILWYFTGNPWSDIGVRWPTYDSAWIGVAVVAAAITFLYQQVNKVRAAGDEDLRRYAAQIGTVTPVIPTTRDELRHFNRLALTAGVVEEFLWRGLLIWYLSGFMGLLPAALVATVAFGVAHAYQGAAKTLQIVLVGFVFTALFLLTKSLLLTVVLHAAADLLQGRLGYEILSRQADDSGIAESSA